MPDKYTYPDTEVLKNKFHVKDTLLLHAYERKHVTARIVELAETPMEGKFDFKHLQSIHAHLFQDIYTWAGKVREIDIGKVDQLDKKLHEFCPSHRIEGFSGDIFGAVKRANYLKDLDKDQFAHKAAEVMGELNELHPFREGNGRTQREFMRQLAKQAGYELTFDSISKERMIEASVAAMTMDYRQLEDIIKESLKPLGLEQTPEFQTCLEEIENAAAIGTAKNRPAKELYNAYAKEALTHHQGVWKPELDKEIILQMKKQEISDTRITAALSHSPALIGLSNIDKGIKTRTLVKEVLNKHPELKKSRSLSR